MMSCLQDGQRRWKGCRWSTDRGMVRRRTVRRLAICGAAVLCAAYVVLGATLSFEQRHSVVQFLDLRGITAGRIGGFRSQWGQVRPLPLAPPGPPSGP